MAEHDKFIDNWNRCVALLRITKEDASDKWCREEQWAEELMAEFQQPYRVPSAYLNHANPAIALARDTSLVPFYKQLQGETTLVSFNLKRALNALVKQSITLTESSPTHDIADDAYISLQLEKMKCEINLVWWKMKYQYQIHLSMRNKWKHHEPKAMSQNPPLVLQHTWPKHHQVTQCNVYVPLALRDEAKADDANTYQSSKWQIPKYTCSADFQSFALQIGYLKNNVAKYMIAFKTHHIDIRRINEDVFDSYIENRPFINGFPSNEEDISDEFYELLHGQYATYVIHRYRCNICGKCAKLINR
jgi:hypothetical protein